MRAYLGLETTRGRSKKTVLRRAGLFGLYWEWRVVRRAAGGRSGRGGDGEPL